jgi:tetratricopeptide (TPR) repeat protein
MRIDDLIRSAKEFETLKNIEEAVVYYKKALEMFHAKDIDNRIFEVQIKLGEIYQIHGDMSNSLKYYKDSQETAQLLGNKIFQVDALNKLAEIYYLKGEIDKGISYAHSIDDLLKNTDYIEGKLEVSLYWMKIFYSRNEQYKARELGNEAIRLCGESHLLYKGRILNVLASGFSNLVTDEEHLDFLEEALECFNEVNSLRGQLSVLNNIGTIYTSKLQNYKKGLEFYFRLKDLSEQNDHLQANIYAYINIGSTLLKCLEYDEAYRYFKEGLKKSETTDIKNLTFFLYINLIEANIKLCNYEEAFYYYDKAQKDFKDYPNQGEAIIYYYRAVSKLLFEVNKLDEAKIFMEKAMDMLDSEGKMIKWSVGYLYELIKVRAANSKEDIIKAVDAIRFILTKYINADEILSMVYDAAFQLIAAGQSDLAFDFVNEYKHIESTHKVIKIKQSYFYNEKI